MASAFDSVFKAVTNSVLNRGASAGNGGLIGQLGGLFGNRSRAGNQKSVKPASEDPYGDPAGQGPSKGKSVKPASEDPYGDPADQKR